MATDHILAREAIALINNTRRLASGPCSLHCVVNLKSVSLYMCGVRGVNEEPLVLLP